MEMLKAARFARDVVLVEGDDARDHLQSQVTQDVMGLSIGDSAWSFILEPKSEIVALVRITRTGESTLVLDTDVGWGDRIRERIDGFLFRMDVSFEQATWDAIAYRGPGASAVHADAPVVAPVAWGDVDGLDVVGPDLRDPDGVPMADADWLESLRIRVGWPRMGSDITEGTTPAMTGLVGETVSFTKGCYTGQEFVARVHYRDAAPTRRLVQVRFHPCAAVGVGDDLVLDGETVGQVTSVASCRPLALGYLKRGVSIPADVTCSGCPATVDLLPRAVDTAPAHQ